ncbi:hypothetical protein PYW07_013437 [Mythimna separata]|uniref:NACHT domain-containing protein n=1 Tax=Mythimna separata TaxID=271217 RepID=A0AAD7Y6G0_MYTSE|nr:hypothetical protein PYW07_013437 [Mythimna separata]
MKVTLFQKGDGTSGIRGQLYETKILSLIFYNAKHDDNIENILICANIAEAGAFDDICFEVEWKGLQKLVNVFIQAKHKDDCEQNLDFDLMKYFRSYLKIRQCFERPDKDGLFRGQYQDKECYYILYTCGKIEVGNVCDKNEYISKLCDLIETGGKVTQLSRENVDLYVKAVVNNDTISLAYEVVAVMSGDKKYDMMLAEEVVLRYHVILAETVVNVSEIKPGGQGHRVASFRQDFFDTKDENLILFKKTLNQEVLKRQNINAASADKIKLLSEFLSEPSDAIKLSKLIGTVLAYNNGELKLVGCSSEDVIQQWNQANVTRWTINQAVELAAKEILLSQKFEVPTAFGNKDLTIRGSDAKIERRINHLASKVIELLDNNKASKMVTIDESLGAGLLQINGGIAGAIGNIFVLDDTTKLMKITDNWKSLEPLAKKLYYEINEKSQNLHEYKFHFKVKKFPKLSFECRDFEESLVEDFFDRLIFFSEQENEKGVEDILKHRIDKYLRRQISNFQVKTDAVFLKYHDKIQEWWMLPKQAHYLSKSDDIFGKAINDIIKDPLMSSLNIVYMRNIKHDYTFTDDAVNCLNLQDQHSSIIQAENPTLTVLKVIQYLKKKQKFHVVSELEYIVNLPTNDREALYEELKRTNKEKVLILINDNIQNSVNEKFTLQSLAKAVKNKTAIIITNNDKSSEITKKYFLETVKIHDERNSLTDMSEESQKSILENARVMFQDKEVKLASIVDDDSKAYVKGDILNKVISKEVISIGKLVIDRNYDEQKHLYIDRRVRKKGENVAMSWRTLDSTIDDVMLILAGPGEGKSTLLTHLALSTKEKNPQVWILRMNLLEYSQEFNYWKGEETTINTLEALNLMCRFILTEKLGKDHNIEIRLEEKENGVVFLKHCVQYIRYTTAVNNNCKCYKRSTVDPLIEFELKLFLHKYYQREIIFQFDGFDEICPHYKDVVINFLKSISNNSPKQRMWITSRPYNEVRTVLEMEFGTSYEIDYFSFMETEKYLESYLEINLNLNELNYLQLPNVESFLQYMAEDFYVCLRHINTCPIVKVYNSAAQYLIRKIEDKDIPSQLSYLNDDNLILDVKEKNRSFKFTYERIDDSDNRWDNPLNLYLTCFIFEKYFKYSTINPRLSNAVYWKPTFFLNSSHFCETLLTMKLRHLFIDNYGIDFHKPYIKDNFNRELDDSIFKHKKLAVYTVFNRDINKLFNEKDLKEVESIIYSIEAGREKTGLIHTVVDKIPIFVHMTFAENFAVNYVCENLLSSNDNDYKKLKSWIDFMFHVMFSGVYKPDIGTIFTDSFRMNCMLKSVRAKHQEVFFNLLLKHVFLRSDYLWRVRFNKPRLERVEIDTEIYQVFLKLRNFRFHVTKSNLDEFLEIIYITRLLPTAILNGCTDAVIYLLDMISFIDDGKWFSVLYKNFSFLSYSKLFDKRSTEEVVELIKDEYSHKISCLDSDKLTVNCLLDRNRRGSLSILDSSRMCTQDTSAYGWRRRDTL